MKSLKTILTVAILAATTVALTAADISGKWTWTMAGGRGGAAPGGAPAGAPGGRGGQARTNTATFKVEGEKLTGTVSMPGRGGAAATDIQITNGKVKGSDVSFEVTREMGGNQMVQKYSGKVEGDTIKGKMEMDMGGNPVSRDWEAKKEKAEKK
jgi:hypothetical protein